WTVTKNGQPYATGTPLDEATLTFTPDDEGSYTVTVKVTTTTGATSTAQPVTITVANAAPVPEIIGAPSSALANHPITVHALPHDPGVADTQTYAWSLRLNGTPLPDTSTGPDFTFTPTFNGVYTISVTATDNDGGAGTGQTAV